MAAPLYRVDQASEKAVASALQAPSPPVAPLPAEAPLPPAPPFAGVLKAAGLEAIPQAEYPSFRQREKEQRDGINRFHRVEIRFTPPESGEG